MSGGRFNYTNEQIAYEMEGKWRDELKAEIAGFRSLEQEGQ